MDARDPAKVEDQVRFLARAFGSCLASGVPAPSKRLARRVPRMDSDEGINQIWLAQWVERQLKTLEVAGSTPVPSRRAPTGMAPGSEPVQESLREAGVCRSAGGRRHRNQTANRRAASTAVRGTCFAMVFLPTATRIVALKFADSAVNDSVGRVRLNACGRDFHHPQAIAGRHDRSRGRSSRTPPALRGTGQRTAA